MPELETVKTLALTESAAKDVLDRWLKARGLKLYDKLTGEYSISRADGLDYWAIIGRVFWPRWSPPSLNIHGLWGFNVHDNGEITPIKIREADPWEP